MKILLFHAKGDLSKKFIKLLKYYSKVIKSKSFERLFNINDHFYYFLSCQLTIRIYHLQAIQFFPLQIQVNYFPCEEYFRYSSSNKTTRWLILIPTRSSEFMILITIAIHGGLYKKIHC